MFRWISIMAGGPQDGERLIREFYDARPSPPSLRAEDGKICCAIATRTGVPASHCVLVHPAATHEQIERAVDRMLEESL
ncbi:hypothetical protein FHW69_002967 [Luteibacter sp. Sphag1AF]|uniref:hypothetical protein n=1 Tax=Luteibacter sp. Sphag1AF TaxID=2587031 RepID=UPI00161BF83B|nr:hypothetical protein [Luteibacter sp. Sphag1AF]MBB3228332.1 hypothetical protein [Luteibacter sp. Sphag1AF]